MSLIWVPATMTSPRRNTQRGIIKNAEKVDTAVIVTDKSRLPPNIIVQMFGNLFVEVKEDSKRDIPGKNPVQAPLCHKDTTQGSQRPQGVRI